MYLNQAKMITQNFYNRIHFSNEVYTQIETSERQTTIDTEKKIFINYYLDFSTSIEAMIRHLVDVKYVYDHYARLHFGVDQKNQAYFIKWDKFSNLIDDFDYSKLKYKKFVKWASNRSKILKKSDFNLILRSKDIFYPDCLKDIYCETLKQRNIIAHSQVLDGAQFNKKTLLKFLKLYFVLWNVARYYEVNYKKIITLKIEQTY